MIKIDEAEEYLRNNQCKSCGSKIKEKNHSIEILDKFNNGIYFELCNNCVDELVGKLIELKTNRRS